MSVKVKECKHGNFMYLDNDRYIGYSLEHYGEYSEGELDLFRQILRPGDIVIEGGAHIGTLTIPIAKVVGPEGRVIAFEPQRILYNLLCGNIALNECWNIIAYPVALGVGGTIKVPPLDYSAIRNFGGLALSHKTGEEVLIKAVDDFHLPSCRLIKADVEGMEIDVLSGAKETILGCHPFLYVENDRDEKSDRLRGLMQDFGYQLYDHKPVLFNHSNWAGLDRNIWADEGQIASLNLFGVPNAMENVSVDNVKED